MLLFDGKQRRREDTRTNNHSWTGTGLLSLQHGRAFFGHLTGTHWASILWSAPFQAWDTVVPSGSLHSSGESKYQVKKHPRQVGLSVMKKTKQSCQESDGHAPSDGVVREELRPKYQEGTDIPASERREVEAERVTCTKAQDRNELSTFKKQGKASVAETMTKGESGEAALREVGPSLFIC